MIETTTYSTKWFAGGGQSPTCCDRPSSLVGVGSRRLVGPAGGYVYTQSQIRGLRFGWDQACAGLRGSRVLICLCVC